MDFFADSIKTTNRKKIHKILHKYFLAPPKSLVRTTIFFVKFKMPQTNNYCPLYYQKKF